MFSSYFFRIMLFSFPFNAFNTVFSSLFSGRNAEKANVGSCFVYGALSMLGCCGMFFNAKVRSSVREQKGIEVRLLFGLT